MIDSFNFERGFFDSKALFSPYHRTQIWADGKLLYDSDKERQSKKPNNNVPKNIKGDYDLSIHGNKIVLVDNKDGTTVEAKCHPDDDFDIGVGMKEAFKKLSEKREELRKQKKEEEKKIKVGDWVEVLEDIVFDPYCGTFFEDNNLMQYAPRFCYGLIPDSSVVGKVLFANKHHLLIEEQDEYGCNKIYLVDNIDRHLKKVAKPNV